MEGEAGECELNGDQEDEKVMLVEEYRGEPNSDQQMRKP